VTCLPQIERDCNRALCPIDHETPLRIAWCYGDAAVSYKPQVADGIVPAMHQVKRDEAPDASDQAGLPQFNRERTPSHKWPQRPRPCCKDERVVAFRLLRLRPQPA
jgi:hypothetical protein